MDINESLNSRKKGAVIKHSHFWEIYESHLSSMHDREINILEIGVYNGGSLYTWRNYFPKAKIVGIDIDGYCKRWQDEDENIFIEIGDQSDPEFLKLVDLKYGPFDIVIDDGGHENNQIITSFETLFPILNNGGIYIVEDTYHSYWPNYSCDRDNSTLLSTPDGMKGGKPTNIIKKKSRITSMEFLKNLVDKLNVAAYIDGSKESDLAENNKQFRKPDVYEKSVFSVHFYDNICIIQKFYRDGINSYGKSTWYPHTVPIPGDRNYE